MLSLGLEDGHVPSFWPLLLEWTQRLPSLRGELSS